MKQEIDNEQFVQVSIDCQGEIPELKDNAKFVSKKENDDRT